MSTFFVGVTYSKSYSAGPWSVCQWELALCGFMLLLPNFHYLYRCGKIDINIMKYIVHGSENQNYSKD